VNDAPLASLRRHDPDQVQGVLPRELSVRLTHTPSLFLVYDHNRGVSKMRALSWSPISEILTMNWTTKDAQRPRARRGTRAASFLCFL